MTLQWGVDSHRRRAAGTGRFRHAFAPPPTNALSKVHRREGSAVPLPSTDAARGWGGERRGFMCNARFGECLPHHGPIAQGRERAQAALRLGSRQLPARDLPVIARSRWRCLRDGPRLRGLVHRDCVQSLSPAGVPEPQEGRRHRRHDQWTGASRRRETAGRLEVCKSRPVSRPIAWRFPSALREHAVPRKTAREEHGRLGLRGATIRKASR